MIRCVVFDFDGTLVMSNGIKREGFFAAVRHIAEAEAAMEALLADPPGDRFAIFAAFAARFGADAAELAEAYNTYCITGILTAPERPGASEILSQLRRDGRKIWINSATPEAPMRETAKRRYPEGTFDGVLGGHARKARNLRAILTTEHLSPAEVLMVGDGVDDREGAREVGCAFAGLDQGSLAACADPGPLITDLRDLATVLSEVPA